MNTQKFPDLTLAGMLISGSIYGDKLLLSCGAVYHPVAIGLNADVVIC
jgi:hypothetical protein